MLLISITMNYIFFQVIKIFIKIHFLQKFEYHNDNLIAQLRLGVSATTEDTRQHFSGHVDNTFREKDRHVSSAPADTPNEYRTHVRIIKSELIDDVTTALSKLR
jgi:hypothetical protein